MRGPNVWSLSDPQIVLCMSSRNVCNINKTIDSNLHQKDPAVSVYVWHSLMPCQDHFNHVVVLLSDDRTQTRYKFSIQIILIGTHFKRKKCHKISKKMQKLSPSDAYYVSVSYDIIGSDNDMSSVRCQSIIGINYDLLSIGGFAVNFLWNSNHNTIVSTQDSFPNAVCNMATILSRSQCAKDKQSHVKRREVMNFQTHWK